MKTIQLTGDSVDLHPARVNKSLAKVIIHLTSTRFVVVMTAVAFLIEYAGLLINNNNLVAYGGLTFLISFIPFAIRETLKSSKPANQKNV
jgi:hypothetical protein